MKMTPKANKKILLDEEETACIQSALAIIINIQAELEDDEVASLVVTWRTGREEEVCDELNTSLTSNILESFEDISL